MRQLSNCFIQFESSRGCGGGPDLSALRRRATTPRLCGNGKGRSARGALPPIGDWSCVGIRQETGKSQKDNCETGGCRTACPPATTKRRRFMKPGAHRSRRQHSPRPTWRRRAFPGNRRRALASRRRSGAIMTLRKLLLTARRKTRETRRPPGESCFQQAG